VGGTKQFRFDLIDQLQPDLIIGNKEENYREGIERLAARYPVWMSDITMLAEALEMIRRVGQLVDRAERATALAAAIEAKFTRLPGRQRPLPAGSFIWQKPYMIAGQATLEPFPFAEKQRQAFLAEFGCPVYLVDGETFSWYGSRLLLAVDYLRQFI
jgi:ABC-type Fe3+-hydroxamate transport system substrate-binding protein